MVIIIYLYLRCNDCRVIFDNRYLKYLRKTKNLITSGSNFYTAPFKYHKKYLTDT